METLSEIAKAINSPVDLVRSVQDGMNRQIRRLPDMDAKRGITVMIKEVAGSYGASQEIEGRTLADCIKLVQMEFGALALEEIRTAYRMWAANKTDAGKRGEMYGGAMNTAQLGAVLAAYCEERQRIVKELVYKQYEENERVEKERRAERQKSTFADEFARSLEEARQNPTDWRDVPEWWFASLKKRGKINFEPGEAEEIFEEARTLAEMEAEREVGQTTGMKKIDAQRALEAIQGGDEARAKVIARKIAVFRKVILNTDFSL